MTIKVTYNSEGTTYITVGYDSGAGGNSVWGDIIGTLSDQADLQAALNAKVPYNGATANVDLGEYELKAGQLELDQTPTGTAGVAVTRWNDSVGTTETTLKGGSVVLKHGRDMFERVVNKTGIQLTKAAYQAVRISTAQGQRLGIALAQANNDNNSADTIGLVVETIENNQEGIIYTVGELDGVNTTGSLQGETWADGDVLYLSPTTAGRVTNVKPVAPQHLVVIGYVVYAHANNGKIYIKVMNGWELGELHDVDTTGATNGQVLKYNGTIWTPSTDVGITGTGVSGQVSYWSGTGTQTGSNNLFWDAANGRLGIGKTTPRSQVDIYQSVDNSLVGVHNYNGGLRISNETTVVGAYSALKFGSRYGASEALEDGTYIQSIVGGNNNNILAFGQYYDTSTTVEGFRLVASNLLIGSTTNSGQRLQVTGDTLLKGSGNTSATTALTVQNSDGVNIINVRNDGSIQVGSRGATQRPYFAGYTGFSEFGAGQSTLGIVTQFLTTNRPDPAVLIKNSANLDYTSGTGNFLVLLTNYSPTSGTGVFNNYIIQPTINQTGGASGITRGLYVNPTLTAAANFRAIEWSNNSGWGLYGAGTSLNYLNGNLGVGALPNAYTGINLAKPLTGLSLAFGVVSSGTIQSDVTNSAYYFTTGAKTQAASFTLPTLYHYEASQGTFGAGSSVTSQFAFFAGASIIGATNNYGFYGNIAAGTGRWNLYMNGTASNYFNGNTIMGTLAADSGEKLQVNGTMKVTGASTFGDNMSLTRTGNNTTTLTITNTTAGSITQPRINLVADGGTAGILKVSSAYGGYKINTINDFSVFNSTSGNITILNDHAAGQIKMAAGGSSTAQWTIGSNGDLTAADGENIIVGTTTGTKLGTATSQKIGFWNATPIVQPTTAVAEATFVENSGGTAVNVDSTFDGYTMQQVVKALRNAGLLA